jgi:predicted DsbA family dithiol-disulfide isomerase
MRASKPLEVHVYYDVLCPWSYVASARLAVVARELGAAVDWKLRPFPLRIQDSIATPAEIAQCVEDLQRARREPEGRRLAPDLWLAADPPRSSIPALAAVESARLESAAVSTALLQSLRSAALEQGINVTHPGVVFELASAVGLNMNRFAAAYESSQTRRFVLQAHRIAAVRGIQRVPTLVIHGRWMLSGLKETKEYKEHLLRCIEKAGRLNEGSEGHLLH